MKSLKFLFFIVTLVQIALAYKLPYWRHPKEDAFELVPNSDGTYKVYTQIPEMPRTYLYSTLPSNITSIYFEFCENDNVAEGDFFYEDKQKFPAETVFFNPKTREVSPVYPYQEWLCAKSMPLMTSWVEFEHLNTLIVLQPIFKSQPPVWLVIQRTMSIPFPGFSGALQSQFLKSGKLYLATWDEVDEDNPREAKLTDSETIPIPYSIFKKSVSKPTCYIMPEDHKLRLCNAEEAKLRTPALKAFLQS